MNICNLEGKKKNMYWKRLIYFSKLFLFWLFQDFTSMEVSTFVCPFQICSESIFFLLYVNVTEFI